MARFIKQGTARDNDLGGVSVGATITVYLSGTTTAAIIYSASSGGSAIVGAQVTTDSNGYYVFYVDNTDYPILQLFDLKLDKLGAPSVTYPDVDIIDYDFSIITDLTTMRSGFVANAESVHLQYHTSIGDGGGGFFRGITGASPSTYVDNNGTIIIPSGGDGSAAWLRDYSGTIFIEWFGPTAGADDIAALIDVLPPSGGTIDAKSLTGIQTFSSDIFTSRKTPFTLLLGAATYEIDIASYRLSLNSHQKIVLDNTLCQPDTFGPTKGSGTSSFFASNTYFTTGSIAASSDQLTVASVDDIEVNTLLAIQGAAGADNNVEITLTSGIDDSTTTIPVSDASELPSTYTVIVGTEIISGNEKSGNDLINVTRGALGSTEASHLSAATVSLSTRFRAYVTAIDGLVLTMSEEATTTVIAADIEVGSIDIIITGEGTIDGRQDRTGPAAISFFGVDFRLARHCVVDDNLHIDNWDHGGVYLESAWGNYVGGYYDSNSRPADNLGASIWCFRRSNENIVNPRSMNDTHIGVFVDDRTSSSNRMDGGSDNNVINIPVGTNISKGLVNLSGSKNNTAYVGSTYSTTSTALSIGAGAGQGTTLRPTTGNSIYAGFVDGDGVAAITMDDSNNYCEIGSTDLVIDQNNNVVKVLNGASKGTYLDEADPVEKIINHKEGAYQIVSTEDEAIADDILGSFEVFGSDSSSAGPGIKGAIRVLAQGGNGQQGKLVFYTADSSNNDVAQGEIDSSGAFILYAIPGNIKINSPNGTQFTLSVSDGGALVIT